jgi:Tol biopolymer transport system component
VAYQTRILERDELFWADRTGAPSRVAVNAPDVDRLVYPDLSPNGQTVAVQLNSQNNYDIWLIDLAGRGSPTRFTFDAEIDANPRWSPDGSQILFTSARAGSPKLYLKASNGAPGSERLLLEKAPAFPEDWSRDGRFLLYMVYDPKTGRDLWAVDMNEKPLTPRPFVNTSFDERNGQFSPDGHWLAYQTDESGRPEVVVVSFPDPTERRNVSTSGGAQPRWRSDGKELYFVASDGRLMAAPITIARQARSDVEPAVFTGIFGQDRTIEHCAAEAISNPLFRTTLRSRERERASGGKPTFTLGRMRRLRPSYFSLR